MLYSEAHSLYLQGEYDDAIVVLDQLMEEFPEDNEARTFRAWCILDSGDYMGAFRAFHANMEADSENPRMWFGLAIALRAMGYMPEALSSIDKAIEFSPQDAQLHHEKGMILLNMEMPDESLEFFDEATRLDEKHKDAGMMKGRVLRLLGRDKEALEAFKKAAIQDPHNPLNHMGIALCLHDLDRSDEAFEHIDKAILISGGNPSFIFVKADMLKDREMYAEAVDAYKEGLLSDHVPGSLVEKAFQEAMEEASGTILKSLGWCLDNLGRHEESLELYTRLTERSPEDAGAWFWKGYALSMNDRKEEAIECYNRSNELDSDPDAYMNIGYILKGMGRFEDAVEAYEGALDLDVGVYDAWEHIGDCQAASGRYDEAVESYRNYLGDDGEGAWVRVKLADSLKSAGRMDEAEFEYREALASTIILEDQYGGNPFTFQARADALAALGRGEEAEEWRIKAAELREHEEEEEVSTDEAEPKNRAVFVEVPKKINEMTEKEKEAFAIEVLNALKGNRKKS